MIDDVSVFAQSLSFQTLRQMYVAAVGVYPVIASQPQSKTVYPGGNTSLSVIASDTGGGQLTYQWQYSPDGIVTPTNLVDGGNVFGSLTSTLTFTNVSTANVGVYDVVIVNPEMVSLTSSNATLALAAPATAPISATILSLNPGAFYEFKENVDPSTTNAIAYDYVGGYNGMYLVNSSNLFDGILGPQPPTFPGFDTGNGALFVPNAVRNAFVGLPAINVHGTNISVIAWINPSGRFEHQRLDCLQQPRQQRHHHRERSESV